MANRYQYRIGVRSELFVTLILKDRDLNPHELSQAVAEMLRKIANDEGGITSLDGLLDAVVYPDWTSVDPEVNPEQQLDHSTIRTCDCAEIDGVQ